MYMLTKYDMILRLEDGAHIPKAEGNRDYEEYLKWAESNETPIQEIEEVVPQVISKAQGKMVLIDAGFWPQVIAFIEAIEDPIEKMKAEVSLNDTYEWRRDSPFLNAAATAIGLSNDALDDLFKAAIKIVA